MKEIIRTVRGDIEPESTGFGLPHEHLLTFPPVRVRPDIDFRLPSVEKAIEEVNMFKKAGGSIIGELTTDGYGRNVRGLREISEKTDVHILSTSGYIMESLFPNKTFNSTLDQLVELFVNDVTIGMDGTDIKAGWVKCGTSDEKMTGTEAKVIRAAARTHHKTGVSITTHTTNGSMAFNQVYLLLSEDVPPERICIGHVDRRSLCIGFLQKLAKTGVFVEFDNVGKFKYYPDSLRVEMIKQLIEEGHVKQILISDDNGRQSYFKSYGGGRGLEYIPTKFVDLMRRMGINDEDIFQMTVKNPRKLMAFKPRM